MGVVPKCPASRKRYLGGKSTRKKPGGHSARVAPLNGYAPRREVVAKGKATRTITARTGGTRSCVPVTPRSVSVDSPQVQGVMFICSRLPFYDVGANAVSRRGDIVLNASTRRNRLKQSKPESSANVQKRSARKSPFHYTIYQQLVLKVPKSKTQNRHTGSPPPFSMNWS